MSSLFRDPYALVGVTSVPEGADLAFALCFGASNTLASVGLAWHISYTRYAARRTSAVPAQIIVTLLIALGTIFGILATSAVAEFYSDEPLLWAPYEVLMALIRKEPKSTAGIRAAAFIAGLALCVGQLGMNVNG